MTHEIVEEPENIIRQDSFIDKRIAEIIDKHLSETIDKCITEAIDKRIAKIEESINELREDVSGLREDVSELREDVSELREDVEDLERADYSRQFAHNYNSPNYGASIRKNDGKGVSAHRFRPGKGDIKTSLLY